MMKKVALVITFTFVSILGMVLFNAVDTYALDSNGHKIWSVGYPDHFIRHMDYRGRIDSDVYPYNDALWIIRPGLANNNGVSFESIDFPGYYLRHRNWEIWLEKYDGSDLFKKDATWIQKSGLCGQGTSFESCNYPGKYIRHSSFLLYLTECTNTLDKQDASFVVESNIYKVSLACYPDYYSQHMDYGERIDSDVYPYNNDGLWIIRPGLANSNGISVESAEFPGYYLRHKNWEIRLERYDGSDLFKKDATWIQRSGLFGQGISFESYNYPGKYIRHSNSFLYLTECASTPDKQNASFDIKN
jgi:hypothetical protein